MKPLKEYKLKEALKRLESNGIDFATYNNGVHVKIGSINFYPTTGKWFDESSDLKGNGLQDLIDKIKKYYPHKELGIQKLRINILSVDELFEIAKNSKVQSLYGICESIHKAIYDKL